MPSAASRTPCAASSDSVRMRASCFECALRACGLFKPVRTRGHQQYPARPFDSAGPAPKSFTPENGVLSTMRCTRVGRTPARDPDDDNRCSPDYFRFGVTIGRAASSQAGSRPKIHSVRKCPSSCPTRTSTRRPARPSFWPNSIAAHRACRLAGYEPDQSRPPCTILHSPSRRTTTYRRCFMSPSFARSERTGQRVDRGVGSGGGMGTVAR
jgi:hypothetical protein